MGSGYTVEGQKTSKEQHGGIQLEIVPECLPNLCLSSYAKEDHIIKTKNNLNIYRGELDEKMTPQQLGCKIGDVLRSYPADPAYEELLKMKHLAKPGASTTCTARRCENTIIDVVPLSNLSCYSKRRSCMIIDTDMGEHSGVLDDEVTEPKELTVMKGKDIKAMGLAVGGKLSKSDHSLVILLLTGHAVQDILQRSLPSCDMEPRRSAHPSCAHPRPSQLRKDNAYRSTASTDGRQSVH